MKRKFEKRIEIPMVSLNPNYLALYTDAGRTGGRKQSSSDAFFYDAETQTVVPLERTAKQKAAESNLKDNNTNGIISIKASKKINQALSWFTALSQTHKRISNNNVEVKHNLSFITLTLSDKQKHSDQFIKNKLLNAFLIDLRRRFYCTSYLWRAEAQSNGNIHFHIVINKYIHKTHISKIWNRIQTEHGYTQAYTAATGKEQPPSTEIKAVYKCKNIAGYLSKYVTKNTSQLTLDSNITQKDLQELIKNKRDPISKVEIDNGIIAAKWHSTKKIWLVKFADQVTNELNIRALVENTGATVYNIDVIKLRNIDGRQWYCSTTISQLKNVSEVVSDAVEEDLQNILQRGCIKYKKIVSEYVTVLCFNVAESIDNGLFKGLFDMFDVNWYKFHTAENASLCKAVRTNLKDAA